MGAGSTGPREIRTITLDPTPLPPPTGRVRADLRQSSIDASLGRMQVWVRNDTVRDLVPTAIRYLDDRFPRVLVGDRLRLDPARSERGYSLLLPARPDCGRALADPRQDTTRGVVEVVTADGTRRVPVEDEADVVARYVENRREEIALAQVATLRWSDGVSVDLTAAPPVGRPTLVVVSSGRPGRTLVIDSVAGSHLLQSTSEPPRWDPAVRIASDDDVTRIPLPLEPARCDVHAFIEGGGATAFRVRYHLDGEAGEVLLRMSPTGARHALDFAREACGLD
ncbi:hypothetical protein [Nocardioides rubriscoriae]|uniref:hypothetical protein n=1 Tax=Nocardioides rubriscoriae TaxID=642762 RepID=UPI0011DF2E6F|nr:hypothetical protein [Nocardioides rubriscoriae]